MKMRSDAELRAYLSPQERRVLAGIAQGLSNQEIADRLGRSRFTVEGHRRELMPRLGIYTVSGLTLFAARVGLIDWNGNEITQADADVRYDVRGGTVPRVANLGA